MEVPEGYREPHLPMSVITVEIYGLSDPRDDKLRYIGKANCAERRLKSHFRDSRRRGTPLYRWIRKLLAEGRAPSLRILESCAVTDWKQREIIWIGFAREIGIPLLNVASGGDQPHSSPAANAANARKAIVSRTSTPEKAEIYHLKKVIGQNLADGVVMEETKELLRYCARTAPHLFASWANV